VFKKRGEHNNSTIVVGEADSYLEDKFARSPHWHFKNDNIVQARLPQKAATDRSNNNNSVISMIQRLGEAAAAKKD
jgi:hypothetical protein